MRGRLVRHQSGGIRRSQSGQHLGAIADEADGQCCRAKRAFSTESPARSMSSTTNVEEPGVEAAGGAGGIHLDGQAHSAVHS